MTVPSAAVNGTGQACAVTSVPGGLAVPDLSKNDIIALSVGGAAVAIDSAGNIYLTAHTAGLVNSELLPA